MLITIILIVLLAAAGAWEFRRHERNVAAVPLRIHVNGTRGKSSVTRLIAAGIRAGGRRTLAKTTGTKPRIIFPDGSEKPILRPGKANIIEQLMVFREAVAQSAEALVMECMAVQPPLQLLAERKMVKSGVGVLTNARADHLDEMGPTVEAVARSLCSTLPRNGTAFTSERAQLAVIQNEGRNVNCRVVPVAPEGVSDEMMAGFSYLEHKDNVALALAVCRHFGVEEKTALAGMHAAAPDPGVLRVFRVAQSGKEVEFVNAFAANDPDSYAIIWELIAPLRAAGRKLIVLVNARADRIQRSEQMGEFIAAREADHYLIAGMNTGALANKAIASGLPADRIVDMRNSRAEEIFEQVLSLTASRSLVIGIGNIVGLGEKIVSHFANRGGEVDYRSR
jgi:poly-gamma-glutamate synthase PgsB/CapB